MLWKGEHKIRHILNSYRSILWYIRDDFSAYARFTFWICRRDIYFLFRCVLHVCQSTPYFLIFIKRWKLRLHRFRTPVNDLLARSQLETWEEITRAARHSKTVAKSPKNLEASRWRLREAKYSPEALKELGGSQHKTRWPESWSWTETKMICRKNCEEFQGNRPEKMLGEAISLHVKNVLWEVSSCPFV